MSDSSWSCKFPTEQGHYWFYGFPWGKSQDQEPQLEVIEIMGPFKNSSGSTSMCGKASGAFVYQSEAAGFWMKIEQPKLPSES